MSRFADHPPAILSMSALASSQQLRVRALPPGHRPRLSWRPAALRGFRRGQREPPSARSVLSPPLLACLDEFAHVRGWPNLENVAIRQRRMLRHELYRMIHVPRLEDENAAELFLGFRIGTVGSCDL